MVTGGATGIGEAAVRLFTRHGAKVMVADVKDEIGHNLCKEIGNDVVSYSHCNVTKESDVKNTVDATVSKFGKLDILYSNAGTTGSMNTNISSMDLENYRKVYDVNVLGSFLAAKHASRVMIPAKKGSILFTASINSVMAGGISHSYASSKHAVVGLANNLCVELGQYGIRVNSISPFTVKTPLFNDVLEMIEKKKKEEPFLGTVNLEESFMLPEDIAEAAVYLASDEARYVSGINLVIDGGYSKINPTFSMVVQNPNPDQPSS